MTASAFRLTAYIATAGLLLFVPSACGRPGSEQQKTDAQADGSLAADGDNAAADANANCPPNSPRISHSCGNGVAVTNCYYPALGQSLQSLTSSCNDVAWVCCADPGHSVSAASYCATDTSQQDQAEITFTERDGSACVTALMFRTAGGLSAFSTPPGYGNVVGYKGACDPSPSDQRQYAIGALGSVVISAVADGGAVRRFDVHVVFFFDNGSGTPDTARVAVDGLAVGSCVGGPDAGVVDANGN